MLKKITVDGRQASIASWVITFALPIALLFLPTSEVFTVPIRTYLAITLWMILAVAFDLFNPLIPGVLVSVLYYVCGVAPLEVAFGCWTQEMAYTLVGCFVMAAALDECGLIKRIAYGAVIKLGGSFTGIVWGVYVGTVLAAVVTFCNAFALAAILVVGVCRSLQLKPNSKEGSIIMIVGLTGVVGCRNFIYAPGASGVVITGFKQVVEDFNFSVGEYMFHNLPHVLYALLFVFILTKLYKTKNMKPLGSLDEIKQQKLWQQGRSKEYYTLITDTLRRYIVDRFGINAMEMTSGEILDIIRKQQEATSVYESLKQIMQLADFVKFAKMNPLPDENDLSLMNAYLFINQTKIEEIPVPGEDGKGEGEEKPVEKNDSNISKE